MFCKKDVLRNFAKFTGKHLCQSLFFNKVANKENLAKGFPVNFAKFLGTPFLREDLRWLLLKYSGILFSERSITLASIIKPKVFPPCTLF